MRIFVSQGTFSNVIVILQNGFACRGPRPIHLWPRLQIQFVPEIGGIHLYYESQILYITVLHQLPHTFHNLGSMYFFSEALWVRISVSQGICLISFFMMNIEHVFACTSVGAYISLTRNINCSLLIY